MTPKPQPKTDLEVSQKFQEILDENFESGRASMLQDVLEKIDKLIQLPIEMEHGKGWNKGLEYLKIILKEKRK